jgi:hypothetical protein
VTDHDYYFLNGLPALSGVTPRLSTVDINLGRNVHCQERIAAIYILRVALPQMLHSQRCIAFSPGVIKKWT